MNALALLFIICFICGIFRGRRILKETHEGKLPGVSRDNEGHATYYFLGDGGFGD